jgi:hypothetical protein
MKASFLWKYKHWLLAYVWLLDSGAYAQQPECVQRSLNAYLRLLKLGMMAETLSVFLLFIVWLSGILYGSIYNMLELLMHAGRFTPWRYYTYSKGAFLIKKYNIK